MAGPAAALTLEVSHKRSTHHCHINPCGRAARAPVLAMKLLLLPLVLLTAWSASAAETVKTTLPAQPLVVVATAAPTPGAPVVYEQRNFGAARGPLVSREQADTVIARFKSGYAKLGSPRLLLSVNRELLDGKPVGAGTNAATTVSELVLTPQTLADLQTRRDVERLFGRPLRLAEARLIDLRVADEALVAAGARTPADTRAALAKVSEVAIEVLVSARAGAALTTTGDVATAIPDVQATAIRLSDSRVIGQASSTDLLGQGGRAAQVARDHGVAAIVEATALALMEDMVQSVK